jgi:hypothetical protein
MVASNKNVLINCAVNGIFPFTFNLPKIVNGAIEMVKVPDPDAIVAIKNGLLFTMFPIMVSETAFKATYVTVDEITGNALINYLTDRNIDSSPMLRCEPKMALCKVNAEEGPASSNSAPDILCLFENDSEKFGLSVIELKDTTVSPLEQIGQAYASGCNIILSHRALGIKSEFCAVPLAFTNGNLYQFGWVTLLEPSVPVLHITTGILDASTDLDQVAFHLTVLKKFIKRNSDMLRTCLSSTQITATRPIRLSTELYHQKLHSDIFYRYDERRIQQSFHYMWTIFEALKTVPEVVKPLGYAAICPRPSSNLHVLIFPKLQDCYSMGVPLEEDDFKNYLKELKRVLGLIHSCNVIHMDLYPSNILWTKGPDGIKIRIVDWDVATFDKDDFSPEILNRLRNTEVSHYYYKKRSPAERKCDYWFLYILSRLDQSEREEMNGDVSRVNEVYRKIVDRCVANSGDRETLTSDFETWFDVFNLPN